MSERKLKYRTLIGYGAGDFGANLFYTGLSLFLLYYYTDVIGLSPTLAGLSIMIGVIWDAVTDPIMGWLATRTRTRFGRFRPYILFGAPFMAICFVLMFAIPVLFPAALFAACTLSHMLFRTSYTLVNIPYGALSAVLTSDAAARTKLSGARMLGAIFGGLIAGGILLSLATALGDGDPKKGWILASCVFAIAGLLSTWVVFFTTSEDAFVPPESSTTRPAHLLKLLKCNSALWIICAAMGLFSLTVAISSKSFIYYMTYNMGLVDDASRGGILSLQALGAALSVPFWVWLAGRISKRRAWICGLILMGITQFTLFMIAPLTVTEIVPYVLVIGFSLGASAIMFWSMVPDTIEFGQWRSGVRDEGSVFAIAAFSQKAFTGIGVGLLGLLLGWAAYIPNVEQTQSTLRSIRSFAFLIPMVGSFGTAMIIWFNPIDQKLHSRLVAAIKYRDRKL